MQPQLVYPPNSPNNNTPSPNQIRIIVASMLCSVVLFFGVGFGVKVLWTSINSTNEAKSADNNVSGSEASAVEGPGDDLSKENISASTPSATGTQPAQGSATNPKSSGSNGSSGTKTSQAPSGSSPQSTADACGTIIYKPDGNRWNCVFIDNFNGSSLDLSKWSVATSPNDFFQLFECYYDRSENVYVAGGYLNLVSRRENPQIGCGWRGGVGFSGGMVRTYKKHNVNRGKVEIRMKIPESKGQYGIGTSLWMIPVPSGRPGAGDAGWYGAWPSSGEIDIAEMYGPFDDYANPSLQYNVKSGHRLSYSCGQENYNAETVTARCNVPGAATSFHTYSVEWMDNTITMVYDGKKVLVDKWDSTQGGTAPFNKDFYLNITQGFANMPIPGPYNSVLPATAQIDYVKIWQ